MGIQRNVDGKNGGNVLGEKLGVSRDRTRFNVVFETPVKGDVIYCKSLAEANLVLNQLKQQAIYEIERNYFDALVKSRRYAEDYTGEVTRSKR